MTIAHITSRQHNARFKENKKYSAEVHTVWNKVCCRVSKSLMSQALVTDSYVTTRKYSSVRKDQKSHS
eukprot:5012224-Amphidinium_carterae.9